MKKDRKIKVLLLSVSLDRKGGVTNYVNLLIQNLPKNKFYVKYFTQGKSPTKWKNIFLPFLIIYQLLKFRRTIKEYKPDAIHINPSLGWTAIIRDFAFMKIAKKKGISVLFFIHGWDEKISEKFKKEGFWGRFFRKRFNLADAIIILASKFKNKLVGLGIDSKKIFVLSTMVESEKYRLEKKNFSPPYNILFCSNMHRKKGPYELLEAAPLVLERYHNTKFTFIGKGEELKNLREKSRELGINENVEFTGYVSEEEKIKKFEKAHIFAYPSYYGEGFPTVVLEAMAASMPLVTTPVGGLANALEDIKQVFLIKSMPPEPKEIAEKIIKLIEHPELMRKMSENNLREAKEKYDVNVVCKKIEEIYEEIIQH